ncbi:patatin-like phospholipase family protein [Pelobium manganitolerans]|uniref:patatin-like phospholipase family protein n=1 Tax=Pelobium manganitolerans TaxID=1842495 RepID=UPI003FA386D8
MKAPKIGLVLSGGGIRGIAHLGVLKAFKDKNIKVNAIAGTSAGAIAGALVANGVDPYEALTVFNETRLIRHLRPAFGSPALLNLETAFTLLHTYIPHNSFEQLTTPLTVTATDFNHGKLVYFHQGELIRKVLASSCIPGVFSPILIDGVLYVDGGVLNNFPIEPLWSDCDFIIGSSCNHLPNITAVRNIKHALERAALLSLNNSMEQKYKKLVILIEPKGLGATSIFDVAKAEEIFWLAYEETLSKIPAIKEKTHLL